MAEVLPFIPRRSLKRPWSFANLSTQVFWVFSALPCQLQLRGLCLLAAAFKPSVKFPKAPGPGMSHVGKVPKGLHSKPKPVFQASATFPDILKPGATLLQFAYTLFSTRTACDSPQPLLPVNVLGCKQQEWTLAHLVRKGIYWTDMQCLTESTGSLGNQTRQNKPRQLRPQPGHCHRKSVRRQAPRC